MNTDSSTLAKQQEIAPGNGLAKDILLSELETCGNPAIRQFILDALHLDFALGTESWHRWGNLAFMAGARLQDANREQVDAFCASAKVDRAVSREFVPQLRAVALEQFDTQHPVIRGKCMFRRLLANNPGLLPVSWEPELHSKRFIGWVRLCIGLGIEALANDDLYAAECCVAAKTLRLSQWFLFTHLSRGQVETDRHVEEHIFVRLVRSSYKPGSVEAKVLTAAALGLIDKNGVEGESAIRDWILEAFRLGAQTGEAANQVGNALIADTHPKTLGDCQKLLAYFPDRPMDTWSKSDIIEAAGAWCAAVHPHHLKYQTRAEFYDCLRDVFDFSFWMGLVARRNKREQNYSRN